VRKSLIVLAALLASACAKGDEAATPMKPGSDTASRAAPAAGAANADPTRDAGGSGPPAGFMARVDSNPNQSIGNINTAKYTRAGDMWEVKTGDHHIVWAPGDTASGNYTVTARLQQMENPSHREAYGVFIGGRNLDRSSQQYLYFVVGGTGEYMISRRDSTKVTALKPWTANNAIPKRDGAGKADNTLSIRVAADSVRFMVNNTQVAALPKAGLPTDGATGIRIGHNLHLSVQPVRITR
jgi:hypothetical protein